MRLRLMRLARNSPATSSLIYPRLKRQYDFKSSRPHMQGSRPMGMTHVAAVRAIKEDISLAEYAVLITLASHLNDKTQLINPKLETIARETHADLKTVKRALKSLKLKGLIEINSGRGRASSEYTLTLPSYCFRRLHALPGKSKIVRPFLDQFADSDQEEDTLGEALDEVEEG